MVSRDRSGRSQASIAPPPNLRETGWNRSFDRSGSLEADQGRDGDERGEGALETDEVGGRGKMVDCGALLSIHTFKRAKRICFVLRQPGISQLFNLRLGYRFGAPDHRFETWNRLFFWRTIGFLLLEFKNVLSLLYTPH
jgi:hypothetical protein